HLAVELLAKIARPGCKRSAATDPQWAADAADARLAGALLGPRLLATATHFGPRLLRLGARATTGEIRGHDLVHQRLVELATERGVGNLYFRAAGAAIDEFELHWHLYFLAGAFLAGATR